MSSSLFTKPSLPVATGRQLPQHPKMRLSYILNPAPPQTTAVQPVISEQVSLPEEPSSDLPSSHCSSDFGDVITAPCVPDLSSDLVGSSLSHNPTPPSPRSSDHEFPHESQPTSCSSSLLLSGDLISSANSFIPDFPSDLIPNLSYNSSQRPETYHDSRNAFGTPSPMNRDGNELMLTPDRSAIYHPSLHVSPLQPRDLNTLANSSILHPESHGIDAASSSPTIVRRPLPRHPKMSLSFILNPTPTVDENKETKLELGEPKSVPPPMSRSPSPSLSESELTSPFTSDFNFNGSPVLSQYPRSDTPPHAESQLSSPATTPPSSPPPGPHAIPDLPQMVQPPQHLPWEGAPPPGLNPRDHRAYQRAGVHWMLAEIFGPDIG